MCLAVPMRVIRIKGRKALVEARGVEAEVDISLAPDVLPDDRVIVHAGFVIEKLDPGEAASVEAIWDEFERSLKES